LITTLVLGLGNMVMGDDAFGIRVIEELQKHYEFSEGVKLVDGGTLGLDLLPLIEDAQRLLIIDALEMKDRPGRVFRLAGDDVVQEFASRLSIHQAGVRDLLAAAELQGYLPSELVVWAIQPASSEMHLGLSPAVAFSIDQVMVEVVAELENWGHGTRWLGRKRRGDRIGASGKEMEASSVAGTP